MTPNRNKQKEWAPKTIYLTRDGWNDTLPEDGEVLWCEDRITSSDVEYRRINKKVKP